MRKLALPVLLCIVLLCIAPTPIRAADPVRLILDTDIGNDIDDALALAMIHALESRREVDLLAVTITKDNKFAPQFVSLVNTFYGRPDIPIGIVHGGKTPEDAPMLRVPSERRNSAGGLVYPHAGPTQWPDAVDLLREILSNQPDHSVTIAQIGFSTNLARLLKAQGGASLIAAKVKALYLMAGSFSTKEPEYNVYIDPEAAKTLFSEWPTPMIFSPFDVGLAVTYPYESIQNDFHYTDNHPIAEAFRLYVSKPEDHPNWDSTAVLEAIQPDRGYFDLSAPGRVELGPKSTTIFTPDPQGRCRYLLVKPAEVQRIRATMAALVSQPPACFACQNTKR